MRELACLVDVADLVIEDRRLGDQVQLLADHHLLDREPAGPDHEQVVASVGVATGLADLRERPHGRERERPAADLAPVADQDDSERSGAFDAVADELAVALLEDVEREGDPRAENRVERE